MPTTAYEFANSEIYVRFQESVRGSDAFVIQSHTAPVNEWIMEHLIMVDALKRASAKRITVVMPFYGYARQDKKHRGREPISARLMADLFKTAGADRLIAVDLHTAQIQGFFDGPVDHLMALPILSELRPEEVRRRSSSPSSRPTPAGSRSPSSGRPASAVRRWPSSTRPVTSHRPNESVANRVVGEVEGRICILVDDMIDTGGTIVKAAEALMKDGAAGVVIAATHAILSDPAVDRLKNCPASEVVVTNTLPIPAGPALRQAHRAVDRAADQPGDPRGLRGRLGHLPVRRPGAEAGPDGRAGGRGPTAHLPVSGSCGSGLSPGPSRPTARALGLPCRPQARSPRLAFTLPRPAGRPGPSQSASRARSPRLAFTLPRAAARSANARIRVDGHGPLDSGSCLGEGDAVRAHSVIDAVAPARSARRWPAPVSERTLLLAAATAPFTVDDDRSS